MHQEQRRARATAAARHWRQVQVAAVRHRRRVQAAMLIMCIDAPESTTNSLSSGFNVDAGRAPIFRR